VSRAALALAALLAVAPAAAVADGVPFWQRLLRWHSGDSSETPVATTMMGKHMQMSVRQPLRPGDAARAEAILAAARRVLARYRDVADAERDGYRAFAPRGVVGEEVHYTHLWAAGREVRSFDPERPGSILYRRTETGMEAVGVMYSARGDAGPEALDARLPLSIAVWHRHVRFCGWPHGTPRAEFDGPDARFGGGSIDTEADCRAAGGYWIPLAFGWMTHVYPEERDPARIWLGEHAMHLERPEAAAVEARPGHAGPPVGHPHLH
jgi:hypothetical protein